MAVSFTPRAVSLIAIAALGIGSFGSSVMRELTPQPSPAAGGVRALGSSTPAVTPPAERLRERVVDAPLPGRGRNPFVYGARVAPRRDTPRDRSTESESTIAVPPLAIPEAPPLPVFRLSGIATEKKDGDTLFIAILIDNGSMVFVKSGDKLSNGYSVVRVEEMSVTLVDASGVTQTIRLP